jgi:hypothetical protein
MSNGNFRVRASASNQGVEFQHGKYIAERYAIADRGPQFAMASEVAASIAAAAGLNGHRAPASTWTIAAIGQPADHGTVAVLTFRERNRAWRIVFMHPAPSSTPTGDASCAPRA